MTAEHALTPCPLQRRDVAKAAAVLVDAFHADPVWQAVFDDQVTPAQRQAAFQVPLRYSCGSGKPGRLRRIWKVSRLGSLAAWPR
jgi:hypothetical protein